MLNDVNQTLLLSYLCHLYLAGEPSRLSIVPTEPMPDGYITFVSYDVGVTHAVGTERPLPYN